MWLLIFLLFADDYLNLADRYFNRGNFSTAHHIYQHILWEYPHFCSSPFLIKLGRPLLYLNRTEEAFSYFKGALKWAKNNREKADALFWLGQILFVKGEYLEAERYFRKSLKYREKFSSDFLYSFGLSSYYQNKFRDAFNLFQNLYEQPQSRYPKSEISLLLGLCCLRMNEPERAQLYLEKTSTLEGIYLLALAKDLLKKDTITVELLKENLSLFSPKLKQKSILLLSRAYINLREYDSALSYLSQIVEDTANYLKDYALFTAGLIHFQREEYKEAFPFFERLLEEFPRSSLEEKTLSLLTKGYTEDKRYSKAIESFKKLVLLYPESGHKEEALYNVAFSYFKMGKFDEAYKESRDFLNLFARSRYRAEMMCLLIRSLIKLGREEEALKWSERVVKEYPDTPFFQEALLLAGNIYLKEKRFSLAREMFFKVKEGKYYPKALKRIGDTYFMEKRYYKAIKFYKRVAEKNPPTSLLDTIHYKIELSYFNLGRYLSYPDFIHSFIKKYPDSKRVTPLRIKLGRYFYEHRDYVKVIEELKGVYRSEALRLIAMSYLNLGEKSMALSYYSELVDRFPKSRYVPEVLLKIGKIYREIGRFEEARVVLNRFLKRYPKSKLLKEVYLEMARSYKDESNWTKAEKFLDISIQRFGPYPQAFLEKGEIAKSKGVLSQARDYFIRASDLFKRDRNQSALALLKAGECALDLNNIEEARELFTQAGIIATDERIHIEVERRLSKLSE